MGWIVFGVLMLEEVLRVTLKNAEGESGVALEILT